MTELTVNPQIGRLLRRSLADEAALTHESDSNRFGQTAQAAIEKALKALIQAHGEVPERIHDLSDLVGTAESLGEHLPQTSLPIRQLTPFAAAFRYDDVPDFSDLEREQIVESVATIRSFVLERIQALTGFADPPGIYDPAAYWRTD